MRSLDHNLLLKALPETKRLEDPLVSIFCFCKDRASTIRRCIESVLNQTYTNFEFVIQDGASTDGTLEIIRSYDDPRIKLVSEPDAGHHEAFWKVLHRCRGEIIASCLADEELLPHAVAEAVDLFARSPRLGAVTRDGYTTDANGKITGEFIAGEFDFVDYLFGRYCPMWVSSFFRRKALLDIGLKDNDWNLICLEFEIWCRLATRHSVKYVPGIVAKYAYSEEQLSNSPRHLNAHLENRTRVIERMFSDGGFFGDDKIKKIGCLYNQNFLFYNHVRAYRMYDQMKSLYGRIVELEKTLGSAAKEYSMYFSDFRSSSGADALSVMNHRAEAYGRAWHLWLWLTTKFPRFGRRLFSKEQRAAIRRVGLRSLFALYDFFLLPARFFKSSKSEPASEKVMYGLTAPVYSKRLYHDVATFYYGRGNVDYAQFLWRKAEDLNDHTIDSIAVQAALMSPTATNESLLARQARWAQRHAKPLGGLPPLKVRPFRGDRKIRVGYFCSFYDGDVIRAMFTPVARCHDREKFTAVAYSVMPTAKDIRTSFDEFKVVRAMSDREFVKLVRNDEIDIFVEMSGFSPLNRFSAMASRCAPIQVAYFNHSGTCGVPNVDYVLADAISVTAEDEKYYSEKVWRLEGDFLFFNYDWANLPEPTDPPCLKNGHITFGCFGNAAKLSDEIVELWAQVLHAVPRSRFYIRNSPLGRKVDREFLEQRFASHGIEPGRLRLDGATDWHTFIRSYEDVDVSLDTWPYCGANTIGESIWQGVPVITLKGDRFSSRYGASHVMAAGCPELIAETPARYVEIAAELSAKPERIRHYRRNLRRMSREHGLSDPARFARKLEKAYFGMMNLASTSSHREPY
jgi:glycosyltransferase involved in cell wall biosynthesis